MGQQKYTPEQVAEAIVEAKGLISVAARSLGCTPRTVRNYRDRYEIVANAIEEAREVVIDKAENTLFEAIEQGNIRAAMYLLSTVGKMRGYVERQEVANDGELNININYKNDND